MRSKSYIASLSRVKTPKQHNFKKRILAFILIIFPKFCRFTPFLCHKYADCTNTDGGYYCECKYGWTGDGYKDCTVILDENGKCSNDICDEVECKVRVLKYW